MMEFKQLEKITIITIILVIIIIIPPHIWTRHLNQLNKDAVFSDRPSSVTHSAQGLTFGDRDKWSPTIFKQTVNNWRYELDRRSVIRKTASKPI